MADKKTRITVEFDAEDEKMLQELMERWGLDINATVERCIDLTVAKEKQKGNWPAPR